MPRHARSPTTLAGAYALFLLVLVLPQARGGVLPSAQFGGLLVAVAALALSARHADALPAAGLALSAVVALVAFQAVPVPPALHSASPGARSLFETVLAPLGLYPAWRPLSLDPPATGLGLAQACTGLAAFSVAWLVGASHRRREVLLLALPVSGLAVVAAVLGRALFGAGSLVAPKAPFVNPNHLASFLVLAALSSLGLALRAHGQRRLFGLLAFSSMAAVVFLTLSRGGIAALLAGLTLFTVLALQRRRREGERQAWTRRAITAAGGLAAAAGVASWLALEPLLREASTLTKVGVADKLAVWPLGLQMAWDFPWFGVGRGAFGTAFPAYKTDMLQVTWVHLENEWLQALVELGWIGGALVMVTLAVSWMGAARKRELSFADAGLLAGVAAVALHNLVDFSLELAGVAMPFMVALGMAMRGARPVAVRPAGVLAAAVALGGAGLAGFSGWRLHQTDREAEAVARIEDPDQAAEAARAVIERHPADWLPHAAVGQRLVEAGRCGEAMPWLNRAMLLDPTAAEPHLEAAVCLTAGGQGPAARREFRLAMAYGSPEALPTALRYFESLQDLLDVVPDTPDGLLLLGAQLIPKRPGDAAVVYGRAWEDYRVQGAVVPLATSLARSGRPEEALRIMRERVASAPGDESAWRTIGTVLGGMGRDDEAKVELERGLTANPGSPVILTLLSDRSFASRRYTEARHLAEQIVARTPAEAASKYLLEARALAGQERYAEAIDRARAAAASSPGTAQPLAMVAAYAEVSGRLDDALQALEELKGVPGQDPTAIEERRNSLRARQEAQRQRRHELQHLGSPPGR